MIIWKTQGGNTLCSGSRLKRPAQIIVKRVHCAPALIATTRTAHPALGPGAIGTVLIMAAAIARARGARLHRAHLPIMAQSPKLGPIIIRCLMLSGSQSSTKRPIALGRASTWLRCCCPAVGRRTTPGPVRRRSRRRDRRRRYTLRTLHVSEITNILAGHRGRTRSLGPAQPSLGEPRPGRVRTWHEAN